MSVIASLAIGIQAQIGNLKKDLKAGADALKNFGASAGSIGKGLSGSLDSIFSLKTAVAGLAAGGLASLTKGVIENIEEQNRFAARIGTSTAALQALDFAATKSHVDVEIFHKELQIFTERLGEAAYSADGTSEGLSKLGITLADLQGLTVDQKFTKVAQAISQLGSQSEKLDVAKQLFGKGGMSLVDLLDQGAGGIGALTAKARELGLVLDDMQLAKTLAADEAIRDLGLAWQGATQVLVAEFAPAITAGVKYLSEWVASAKTIGSSTSEGFQIAAQVASVFINILKVGFYTITTVAFGLIAAIASVVAVLDKARAVLTGGEMNAAIQDFARNANKNFEAQAKGLNDSIGAVFSLENAFGGLGKTIETLPPKTKAAFETISGVAANATKKVKDIIRETLDKIQEIGKPAGFSKLEELKKQGANKDDVDKAHALERELQVRQKIFDMESKSPLGAYKKDLQELREAWLAMPDQRKQIEALQKERKKSFKADLGITQLPIDKIKEESNKLKEAFGSGLIDRADFVRGLSKVQSEATSTERPAALQYGSNEARETILKATTGSQDLASKQYNAQIEANKILERIANGKPAVEETIRL